MTTNPTQTPDDNGPVNPPHSGRGSQPLHPAKPSDPDDESIHSTGESDPDEPGAVIPRVLDDIYDPRTRTGRTTRPGLDPPS